MLGLFIKSPWPSFYKKGMKTWEIRSYPTDYRGDILLIESGTNKVICKMTLTDCVPLSKERWEMNFEKHRTTVSYEELPYRNTDGLAYAWIVTSPKSPSKDLFIERKDSKPYMMIDDSILEGINLTSIHFNAERIACKFIGNTMLLYWLKKNYFALVAIIELSTGTTQVVTSEISSHDIDYVYSQLNANE